MEFIQTKNYGGPMTVVFTGEKYLFNDNFFGLVAIATRAREHENDVVFDVSICQRMNPATLKRIIGKNENRYIARTVVFNETYVSGESLPYNLEMRAVAR